MDAWQWNVRNIAIIMSGGEPDIVIGQRDSHVFVSESHLHFLYDEFQHRELDNDLLDNNHRTTKSKAWPLAALCISTNDCND